jgi:formate dehydrogenase subunit gamma
MLHYFTLFPDSISTGATFVHDVFAAAVVVVSAGHLWMAWQDPEARRGLRTGHVSRRWAEREHSLWAATVPTEPPPDSGPAEVDFEPPA